MEIVDIAYPPDQQLEIVREAAKRPHVKGILAQKPVAFTLAEAVEMVKVCDENGKKLGVNHNMRYDQSMRALKTLLDRGELGDARRRRDRHECPAALAGVHRMPSCSLSGPITRTSRTLISRLTRSLGTIRHLLLC